MISRLLNPFRGIFNFYVRLIKYLSQEDSFPSGHLDAAQLKKLSLQKNTAVICILGAHVGFGMFLSRYLLEGNLSGSVMLILYMDILAFIAPFAARKFNRYEEANLIMFTLLLIAHSKRALDTGGLYSSVSIWFVSYLLLALNLLTGRRLVIYFSLCLLTPVFLYFCHVNDFLVNESFVATPEVRFFVFMIGVMMCMVGLYAYIMNQRMIAQNTLLFEREMAAVDKTLAIGHFAANLTHEISSPTNLIKNQISDFPESGGGERLKVIERATNQLLSTIRDIRLISATNSDFEFDCISTDDLIAIARSCFANLGGRARLGVDLEVRNNSELNELKIHKSLFKHALNNIIDNAIYALEKVRRERNPYLGIEIDSEGGGLVIRIANNGDLIPEEIRYRIFEQFFTTKGEGKGSGIGLYLSRKIVERHGGKLGLLSTDDLVTFEIKIP